MDLNAFTSFFEIFAALNFAYAGSETFREALDETILGLNSSLENIRSDLNEEAAELFVDGEGQLGRDEAREYTKRSLEFEELSMQEKLMRNFPIGIKTSFFITGLYCLAVIIVAGFAQFFSCSQITYISLSALTTVILYNIVTFLRSLSPKWATKPISLIWPVFIFSVIVLALTSYVNFFSDWLPRHIESHLIPDPVREGVRILEAKRFEPHFSLVDVRWTIALALLTSVSPFLFHFLRVKWHERIYRKKYKALGTEFETLRELKDATAVFFGSKLKPAAESVEGSTATVDVAPKAKAGPKPTKEKTSSAQTDPEAKK